MPSAISVNIKMYQVGELGDCFLLSFKEDGNECNVLIDCGSFRNGDKSITRMNTVVTNIKSQLKSGKLDIVVGTHQHNDHLSGYEHAKAQFKNSINQVWLSWLDDPNDALARQIGADHQNLISQLTAVNSALTALKPDKDLAPVKDILGFYGLDGTGPGVPARGLANLKEFGAQKVEYLTPGEIKSLPGLSADAVKVYVLGPPKDQKLLFDKDPAKGESYDHALTLASQDATRFLSAINNQTKKADPTEEMFPFSKHYKRSEALADKDILKRYHSKEFAWKRIDKNWLDQANQLALYLDSYTNNSSLVLAFELVNSGKVLLFVGDAQIGNWLSWDTLVFPDAKKDFKANNLLERTVLYKVGHHASHNATLVQGLEAMKHEELVAMIPVDKTDPNITKPDGWKMPADNLYKRIKEKTKYRVLRMDDGFADECNPSKAGYKGKWNELPFKPKINNKDFYVEYEVYG